MSASVLQRGVGELLGDRYRIVSVLGEGGFGSVYAADDLQTGQRVAVKCLHAHLALDHDVVVRFRREARAATEIGHPGIVQVIDFGALSDGSIVMAMELLHGEDLATKLEREGALRVSAACQLVMHVCAALGAAHDKGIVHRDLKPDNIFLPGGEGAQPIKLLDFGISKFQAPAEGATLQTKTGTAMGTPFYMSPEQAQGKRSVDARADIYSLGVILFRLLTAQHPFEDDSYPMLVLKICTEPPPPVRRYRMDVPMELDALVSRMLSKDPDQRPASCAELIRALEPFAAHDVDPVLTPGVATRAMTPSALSRVHSPLAMANTAISSGALGDEPGGLDLDPDEQRALGGGPKPYMVGLAVMVAVAAAAAVAWVLDEPDAPDPSEQAPVVALPTPTEPDIAPLTTPPPTALGWRFEHPRPRAMPSWKAVAVGGPGLVGVVGNRGQAGRFADGRLIRWPTGTLADLHAIAWATADSAWVVGDDGELRRLGAGEPERIVTDTDAALRDVLVVSPTEVVAVGDRGTFLRVLGQRLVAVPTGVPQTLFGAHARDGVVFAVGQGGVILRVEGDSVSVERPAGSSTLRAVGGCPRADLYAVGDDGHVMRREPRGTWRRVPGTGREGYTGITCDDGRAAAAGNQGSVLLLSGERSVRLASGTDQPFRDIAGAEGTTTWVVGDAGRLALMANDHLILLTEGTSRTLRAAASLAGRLVVVGEWGTLLRQGAQRFVPDTSGTDAALAGLASYQDDTLVAVGDQGVVLAITWEAVREVSSPTQQSLRAVVAGDGWLTAVGVGGTIVRGPLEALQTETLDNPVTLWGVSGGSDEAIAVGDEGTVLRVSRLSTQRVTCPEARGLRLRAVFKGASDAYAVGVGGAILRVHGDSCVLEQAPSDERGTLFTVGLDDEGRVFAVGDEGVAFVRGDDGSWSTVDLGIDVGVYGMLRTDRDVWLLGASGAVLRRPRTDGPESPPVRTGTGPASGVSG